MADRKLFKDVLFELFKEYEQCEKMVFKFMRAYDIFDKKVKGFSKLATTTQYYICDTACRIDIASSDSVIRTVSIFRLKDKYTDIEIEYGLDYGWCEPEKIELVTKVWEHDFKRRD